MVHFVPRLVYLALLPLGGEPFRKPQLLLRGRTKSFYLFISANLPCWPHSRLNNANVIFITKLAYLSIIYSLLFVYFPHIYLLLLSVSKICYAIDTLNEDGI